ncbi:hypothetical protein VNO77_00147 [Canavalia gladiata]|uniref:Two-component response regulator n=1 Tax=Canavalia gladiata TaxID=3824 RepID=A0AAN9MU34_CANGL
MDNDERIPHQFPASFRVLAIDHDNTVLENIEKTCIRYKHHVTLCRDAAYALNLVWERKGYFDVILVDANMPNMDGYEFVHRVNQEINVPVIMMSVDDAPSDVLKSIKYGACDYWVKPLREDDFKNLWRHVARKVLNEDQIHQFFVNLEDDNSKKLGADESEVTSVTGATEPVVRERKSTSREVEVDESDNSQGHPAKKRIVWTPELHEKFVKAVMQLGHEKAVPKKILQVMNEPELTRASVASHLQKYRIFLKSSDGETSQQQYKKALLNAVPGRFDLQPLAAGSNANMMPKEDQTIAYAHPLPRCPLPNITNNFPQSIVTMHDASTAYRAFPSSSNQRNTLHCQQNLEHQQPMMHHPIHSINSRMVLSGSPGFDTHGLLSPQSNNSLLLCNNLMSAPPSISLLQNSTSTRHVMRSFCTVLLPVSETQVPQGSRLGDSILMHPETQVPYGSTTGDSIQHHDTQVSCGSRSSYLTYHESPTNLGRAASDICIPTISPSSDFSNGKVPKDVDNNGTKKGPNSMNTRQ